MVCVPEDLEVRASYELQGGGDHEEQGHGNDVPSDASGCDKADSDRILKELRESKGEIYAGAVYST